MTTEPSASLSASAAVRLAYRRLAMCCLLFVCGLWIVLGVCWADIVLQEACGWSPLGATEAGAKADGEIWISTSEDKIHVNFRGTTASFRDIQTDLALGLSTAFPFASLHMSPFLPQRLAQGTGSVQGADAGHVAFVGAWLTLPLLAILFALRVRWRKGIEISLVALALAAAIYVLGRNTVGVIDAQGAATAEWSRTIIRYCFLAMLGGSALVCCLSVIAAFAAAFPLSVNYAPATPGFSDHVRAGITWLYVAIIAILIGLWAKASLWLGWYTNDTRVNLLEPLSSYATLVGAGLALFAVWYGAAMRRKHEGQVWYHVASAGGMAAVIAIAAGVLIPNPPRISTVPYARNYIQTIKGDVVDYGDWDESVRATNVEFAPLLKNSPDMRQQREELQTDIYGFNSANVYSHLFGKAWVTLPLIVFAIAALGSVLVMSAWTLGLLAISALAATRSPTWPLARSAAMQWVTCGALALWLGSAGANAFRAHSMDLMLMRARGDMLEPAFRSLMAYQTEDDPSGYWKLPWQMIPLSYLEFDKKFGRLADLESSALRDLGTYGATDNFSFPSDFDLEIRRKALATAVQSRTALLALCEIFPDEIEFRLAHAGFPQRLVYAAAASWTRELGALRAASVARLLRLNAERSLLDWMAYNRQNWTARRPGAPPEFAEEGLLAEFVNRLSEIAELKEAEIRLTRDLDTRLTWVDSDYRQDTELALRLIAIQRRLMSLLSNATQNGDAGARQFVDPSVAERYAAALQDLDAFQFPVAERAQDAGGDSVPAKQP